MTRPTVKSFGACLNISSGNSIPAAVKAARYMNRSEGLPYIGTKDVGFDGTIAYDNGVTIPPEDFDRFRRAPANSVLVCAEGGSAGRKVGLLQRDVFYGNKLFCLAPHAELDADYLYFFCRSPIFRDQFKARMAGVIGGVSKRKFDSIELPFVDKQTQKLRAQTLRMFEQEFSALTVAATQRRGLAREAFTALLEAEIGGNLANDSGWNRVKLKEISSKITDGVHHTPKYVESGVPFVTVRNLTAGPGIDLDNLKYVSAEDHADYCKRAHPGRGDILISKDGTIGVVRLVETDQVFSIFVSVAMIQLLDKTLAPFVTYALQAPSLQRQMTGKGTALKHLYLEDLREIVVPIPTSAEQRLSLCNRLATAQRYVEELEANEVRRDAALSDLWDAVTGAAFLPHDLPSRAAT